MRLPHDFWLGEEADACIALDVPIHAINFGGHLAHDALLSLMHEARCRFLRQLDLSESAFFERIMFMREVHILYEHEAFYGERLIFALRAEEGHGALWRLHYCVTRDDQRIALARTDMAVCDRLSRRACRVPAAWDERLRAWRSHEAH